MEKSNGKLIAIKIWLIISTILSVLFIAVCIIGGVQSSKRKQQANASIDQLDNQIIAYNINNDINYRGLITPSSKAISYNDVDGILTLDSNDIQNYNLWYGLVPLNDNANYAEYSVNVEMEITTENDYSGLHNYSGINYEIEDTTHFNVSFTGNNDTGLVIHFINTEFNDVIIQYRVENILTESEFTLSEIDYFDINDDSDSEFYDYFYDYYLAVNSNINDGIFETLSESVVDFIGSLSAGITSVIAVFYSNNSLTLFGNLAVIVVAITLGYFLFRLIFGLIRMRG